MPITLSALRSARDFHLTNRLLAEIFEQTSGEHRGGVSTIERLRTFFSSDDIHMCAWTNVPATEGVWTGDGMFVAEEAFAEHGFHCDVCDESWHNNQANGFRGDGCVCDHCVSAGRVIWSRGLLTYILPTDDNPDDEDDNPDDEDTDEDEPSVGFIDITQDRHPHPRMPPPFYLPREVFSWPALDGRSAAQILNYSYNPMQKLDGFRYMPDEPLPLLPRWLGVELEVEPRAGNRQIRCVEATAAAVGHFAVMKHDSSIGEGGFEIVTVPATIAYHRKHWEPFFKTAAPMLRSWESGRCGMHVHISRAAISTLRLGYMLAFINEPANLPFIEAIAGRGSTHYSSLQKKRIRDAWVGSGNRYEALSTATNKPTVELRIFRGNVSRDGFYRNLDFADALVAFAMDTSATKLGSQDFLTWLDGHRPEYPYLAAWAARKGMIRAPKKPLPAEPAYQA